MKYPNLAKTAQTKQIYQDEMYPKFSFAILTFALIVTGGESQTTKSEERSEDDVFVPTREWQTIKEGKKTTDRCHACAWCIIKGLPPRSENPQRLACSSEFTDRLKGS